MKTKAKARIAVGVAIVALPATAALVLVETTSSIASAPSIATGEHRTESRERARPIAPRFSSASSITSASAPANSPLATPSASPLASAIASLGAADDDARERAKQDVLALAAQDAKTAARALIAALRAAKDDGEAEALAEILGEDDALARLPEVASALADIAEHDAEPFRRAAAVKALADLPEPDVARVGEVARIARGDRDDEVRQAAAYALGDLGQRAPGDVSAQASREIASSLAQEPSGAVRTGLVYSVRDTREPAVVDAILGVLANDGEPAARQAAADVLGDVAPAGRARSIAALVARFDGEVDRDLRLTLVTSIIRAGREDAAAALEQIRPRAGDLAQDLDDYLAGLRSGEADMDRLFAMKQDRERARGAGPGSAADGDRDGE